ncbi:MAG: hypothetical protein PVI92_07720, partial [Chromatiales bacterium]
MLTKCLAHGLAAICLLTISHISLAGINLINGKYAYDALDLKVKTLGGSVSITRSWNNGSWVFNYGWAPLTLSYSVLETEDSGYDISAITRGDESYAHNSQSTSTLTLSDGQTGYHKRITYQREGKQDQWIIREGEVAGEATDSAAEALFPIRWESLAGDWIEYLKRTELGAIAKIDRYGDRTGVTASFVYDSEDRLVRIDDRAGNPLLTYTYTDDGKLQTVKDNTGRGVEYRYSGELLTEVVDVRGNLTQFAYENDRLVRITNQEGRVKALGYASNGRISSETLIDTDGTQRVTRYGYDYDKTRKEIYIQVKNPLGSVTEKWYDKDRNLIRKVINNIEVYTQTIESETRTYHVFDQRGLETVEEYDAWFNQVKVTYPDGSSISKKYKPATNLVTEAVDELGRVTQYSYYDDGKLKQKTEAVETDVERATTYLYNDEGQLIEKRRLGDDNTEEAITTYGYDDSGNLNQITGPEGGVTRFTHNTWGAVVSRTDPNEKDWDYTYDNAGNRLSQTDPLTHTTKMTYDGLGNLKSVTDARENTTEYAYNINNQRISVTDPLSHATQMGYDLAGQLTSITDPLGNTQTIVYDLRGRMISQQDAAGNTTTLGYGEKTSEGGGLNGTTTYPGQLNRTQHPTYLQTYDYDKRNRRTQTIDHLDGGTAVTVTKYDLVGNKIETVDAENRVTQYRYDALNRLIEIIDPLNQSTSFSYDNRDNLLTVTDPNTHTTTYTYDKADRKTSEIHPGGQTISYTYDPAGNLKSTTDPDGRKTVNHYDDAGRLEKQ